jgi:hypothetical protein
MWTMSMAETGPVLQYGLKGDYGTLSRSRIFIVFRIRIRERERAAHPSVFRGPKLAR